MVTLITSNINEKFVCEKCDFVCSKKGDWNRHILTIKHERMYNVTNDDEKLHNNIKDYVCEICSKKYNSRNGLWSHKKKCTYTNQVPTEEKPDIVELLINENKEFKNVIIDLVKNNQELQKQMMEVCKNSNTTNNNNINSHNKTFNLQFFLNEQCKDAMNIMDFVDTFQLQIADLERVGEIGFVQGISNIIIDKLSKMDIYKRPIHCSDAKRETMHIKDKGVWEKDNENNDKLRLAVKHITHKNLCLIAQWRDNHPGVANSEHRLNDKYSGLIIEAMGGKNKNTMQENETKIIKKISKMVLIDKTM